jgi:hypothetical protein
MDGMCGWRRAGLVVVLAIFEIGEFAQRPKEFVACESFSDKFPFATALSGLALANTSIF